MSKKIEISTSSLVSLKAELARKQEEVNRAKSEAKNTFAKLPSHPKKQTVLTRKNAGVDNRNATDCVEIETDEDDLKKSRAALEVKSKLYDRLSRQSSSAETDDRQFLVDFEQKSREDKRCIGSEDPEEEVDQHYSDDDDDWAEYTDCLGRTRRCLREDLSFVKEKDAKLAESLGHGPGPGRASPPAPEQSEEEPPPAPQPELSSAAAAKREEMRRRWEEQELRLRDKTDVHYQDVLFDEARAHGVGYYGFSGDEAERRAQQEALARLRQETAARQQHARQQRLARQRQLAERLAAARSRQRARLGLPPLPPEPEKQSPGEEEGEEEEVDGPETAETQPPEETPEKSAEPPKKVPRVRPWDIGKLGVPTERQVLSQEEWVKERRGDRQQEFAPPPSYSEEMAPRGRSHETAKKWGRSSLFPKKQPDSESDVGQGQHDDGDRDETAPPSAYVEDVELLGPQPTMFFTTKRQKVPQKVGAPGGSSVQQEALPRSDIKAAPPPAHMEDMEVLGPEPTMFFTTKRQKMPQKETAVGVPGGSFERKEAPPKSGIEAAPPPAYLEDMELLGPEPTMFFTTKRQKMPQKETTPVGSFEQKEAPPKSGVEIAPPPTYEYYGPTPSTLRRDMNKQDMEKAIVAGLKYLRQHAEDKEAQPEKGMLPIV
ncbi:coiled-coil domain-containing protein 174 [Bacillus rossius redtenbacheri]|uniref:coiled-coil domain-containing protein 174 n=1 Tax=Bacillus rossius redtenbacheri TaxID=93214 RepID=UPI002FDD4452